MLEMLVVMILSSLIAVTVYGVYYSVNTYQLTLSKKYDQLESINFIVSQMTVDIDQSDSVIATTEARLICYRKKATIVYTLMPEALVRTQGDRVDSLACLINTSQLMLDRKQVIQGLVDEITIDAVILDQSLRLVFFKAYDAAGLIRIKNLEAHD